MASGGGGDVSRVYVLCFPDELAVNDVSFIIPGRNRRVSRATGQVAVAPTGDELIIAIQLILRSDNSIVSTLGSVTWQIGAVASDLLSFTPVNVPDTHAIRGVITQVGSTLPGEDACIEVY